MLDRLGGDPRKAPDAEGAAPRRHQGTAERHGVVVLEPHGRGNTSYRSPVFRWDSPPLDLDVDVSGVAELQLEVGNEVTWHNAASSVNWADLRLGR